MTKFFFVRVIAKGLKVIKCLFVGNEVDQAQELAVDASRGSSNNVDPLVSGFGSIYWTVKYICPVNLLSVLIFSKPTRACRGHPSSKHVCRPLALARPTPCILVQRPTQGVPIISGMSTFTAQRADALS
jgi:hypothetical protein